MAEAVTKLPVSTESKGSSAPAATGWHPFETLRRELDRLFDDFDRDYWRSPFRRSLFDIEPLWRRELTALAAPVADIAENEGAYEISVELPGLDEKNIDVKLSNGMLTVKGEKREEREEKKKGYHLQERRFGAFERTFRVPDDVDTDKIEANFSKGVLCVTLPKKPEAVKPEKKISVKAS